MSKPIVRPCDGDCFTCRYPDCVRTGEEILHMETVAAGGPKYHFAFRRRDDWDLIPTPEEIKALRGDLQQAEFAALVGVQPPTVSGWENGRRHPGPAAVIRIRELMAAKANG